MSRGSNAGDRQRRDRPAAEARSLEDFFAATREGMLRDPALPGGERAATDLLWRPGEVARRTMAHRRTRAPGRHPGGPPRVRGHHRPARAWASRTAMSSWATPRRCRSVDEVYGVPVRVAGRHALRTPRELRRCAAGDARAVSEAFSDTYDARPALAVARAASRVGDAFARPRRARALQLPGELHAPAADGAPAAPCLPGQRRARTRQPDDESRLAGAGGDGRPLVVVSFGTFLSARERRPRAQSPPRCAARRPRRHGHRRNGPPIIALSPCRGLAGACQPAPSGAAASGPTCWSRHGGNNSVTEALTHGVPHAGDALLDRPVRRRRSHRAAPGRRGARPEPQQPRAHRGQRPWAAGVAPCGTGTHRDQLAGTARSGGRPRGPDGQPSAGPDERDEHDVRAAVCTHHLTPRPSSEGESPRSAAPGMGWTGPASGISRAGPRRDRLDRQSERVKKPAASGPC